MPGDGPQTKLVLLGTAGGPTMQANHPERSGPASVVVVDDRPYLVDCGWGATQQFLNAGFHFASVDHIFVTHQHFDHNADLANFLAHAWFAAREKPIDIWGPPPLQDVIAGGIQANTFDVRQHEEEEGHFPFAPIPRPHEIPLEGKILDSGVVIMQDDSVRVTGYRVIHGTAPTIALRIKTADRDIVFSGDRGGQDDLASFAQGADVLVHEIIHYPVVEELLIKNNRPAKLYLHHQHNHSSPETVGRTATEAGVGTLVLNHFVPASSSLVSDDEWIALTAKHFAGEIVVGRDLMVV